MYIKYPAQYYYKCYKDFCLNIIKDTGTPLGRAQLTGSLGDLIMA